MLSAFKASRLQLPKGEAVYTVPGSFSFIVPANVTSISMVGIGGGQGGYPANTGTGANDAGAAGAAGELRYLNTFPVSPGQQIDIVVGAGGVIPGGAGAQTTISRSGVPILTIGAGPSSSGAGSGGTSITSGGSAPPTWPGSGTGLYGTGGAGTQGTGGYGGYYDFDGGGSISFDPAPGTAGGVRLIWGTTRSFPSQASA